MSKSDLDSILEQSLSQIAAGKADVAGCLASNPEVAGELAPLLVAAEALRAVPKPSLRPEARAQIEERVLAAAAANPRLCPAAGLRPRKSLPRGRWVFGALTSLVILISLMMMTVVTASAEALPGSALYPVKLATEDAWLWLAPAQDEPGLHVRFARRRLAEAEELAKRGAFDASVLDALAEEVGAALVGAEDLPSAQALLLLDEIKGLILEQQQELAEWLEDATVESRTYLEGLSQDAQANADLVETLRDKLRSFEPTASPTLTGTPLSGDLPQVIDLDKGVGKRSGSVPRGKPLQSPAGSKAKAVVGMGSGATEEPSATQPADAVSGPAARPSKTAVAKPTKPPKESASDSGESVVDDPPKPTRTPKPTKTEKPTKTPKPEAPELGKPTEPAAAPGLTGTPEPTETLEPTDTPEPTETLEPTETPEPTETLEPTETPEPDGGGPGNSGERTRPPVPTRKPKPTKAPKTK